MEIASLVVPSPAHKQGVQRRTSGFAAGRDLWLAARTGSFQEVDLALALLKKNNGNIDARNVFGSTALHIAAWRNHIPIVRRLLAAGANPDARDGESGWSSLHRALHFGHLAVAGVLIEAGASLVLEDSRGRTPVDLLSGPIRQAVANPKNSVSLEPTQLLDVVVRNEVPHMQGRDFQQATDVTRHRVDIQIIQGSVWTGGTTEVYSWGNGANYQLGTGTAGIQRIPCRIDALQSLEVTTIAAGKFHSAAITAKGAVYTWGFGRGGRLGHPDFDIHSGQVAVITPRQVLSGLGVKTVTVIAVAKHHTIAATDGGEVYTWGSNREGRLGYPSVDTQPTPRKVSTLKARVVAVAAANKHSAVLTEGGEVYTWGCNREGQLGYGTSNSTSNYVPRSIEYLKGRHLVSIAAAKYHTVALGAEGEVLTWGYKMVNPRRVIVARDTKKKGSHPLKFHRADRLHVVAVSAGMTHSTAVTDEGLLYYWVSADPNLRPHHISSLTGHQVVAVAAGKYRTAIATSTGSVYAWDGEGSKADVPLVPVRVCGIKHATGLSVGETHSLAVAALYVPVYSKKPVTEPIAVTKEILEGQDPTDETAEVEEDAGILPSTGLNAGSNDEVPTLKDLCQKVIAESIVEPKNSLQLLEFADSLGADHLRRHCEDLVLRNLDYILTISPTVFAQLRPTLLAELEKALDSGSGQPWSHRLLPTPTATLPVVVDSEEDDSDTCGHSRVRSFSWMESTEHLSGGKKPPEGFLLSGTGGDDPVGKQLRAVRKKLQQIEALELKQSKGQTLDSQQLAKLQTKYELQEALSLLEAGILPVKFLESPKVESNLSEKFNAKGVVGLEEGIGNGPRGARHSGRRKSKGSGSRGMILDALEAPITKEAGNDFDLQETLEQIAQLERQSEMISESTQSVTTSPYPTTPLNPENSPSSSVSFKEISGFSARETDASSQPWPLTQAAKSTKKKSKRGGLSMFLSGALEAPPKPAPVSPPPPPKVEGPAWGGAHMPKGPATLREIQTQQTGEVAPPGGGVSPLLDNVNSHKSITSGKVSPGEKPASGVGSNECGLTKGGSIGKLSGGKHSPIEKVDGRLNTNGRSAQGAGSLADNFLVGHSSSRASFGVVGSLNYLDSELVLDEVEGGPLRVPLSQFVRGSAPIAVTPTKGSQGLHPENSTPPWAGRSPGTSAPSLRDIQLQQVKQHKAQQRQQVVPSRGSPQLTSRGLMSSAPRGSIQTMDHGSPSTEAPNRWYKPENITPSPLRCIQKEEEAMKELRRLYKNVKIVTGVDI